MTEEEQALLAQLRDQKQTAEFVYKALERAEHAATAAATASGAIQYRPHAMVYVTSTPASCTIAGCTQHAATDAATASGAVQYRPYVMVSVTSTPASCAWCCTIAGCTQHAVTAAATASGALQRRPYVMVYVTSTPASCVLMLH